MPQKKTTHKKPSIRHIKTGKSPGTVTYLGNREGAKSVVNIMDYNLHDIKESTIDVYVPTNFNTITAHKTSSSISWINIIGISDEKFIENLGNAFSLNPLTTEDAVNTHQRPKTVSYTHLTLPTTPYV